MSPNRYPIPAKRVRTEIEVLRSRFISTIDYAPSVEKARELVRTVQNEMPDASHHVPAFIIGWGESITSAHGSDAGEPSGTAGRPSLIVLQGSGFGDIALVTTRYFGGTKLGTGGLVKAYTEAAQTALAALPRAMKVSTHTLMTSIDYANFELVKRLASAHHVELLDQDFGADVTLSLRLAAENYPAFCEAMRDLTHGKAQIELIEADQEMIVPWVD